MNVRRMAQTGASRVAATVIGAAIFILTGVLPGQQSSVPAKDEISARLAYGEFAKALELANQLPPESADENYQRIAVAQSRSGAHNAAADSLRKISSDKVRFKALFQINGFQQQAGPAAGFGGNFVPTANGGTGIVPGLAGGVTEADFQPLIRLIKSTIDPDTWDDANGDGTIQAYPTGVYVDSSGTLQKLKFDSRRNLRRLAAASSRDTGNRLAHQSAALRKVSLNRLERQVQLLAAEGRLPDEDMRNLAGIYEIKFLLLLPESKDVVLVGPAGPWTLDNDGHAINIETGKPVLQLDDLVVCLRNAQSAPLGNHGKFGCAITPRKKNLAATHAFLATSKLKGDAWRNKLRQTLGLQDIEVFGIDPATHAGRTMVEADYHMKLVAMGLEPSIPEVPGYLARLTIGPGGEVEPMDVVRWWFTMNYEQILMDETEHLFGFTGTGVKVLSENEFINEQGDRIHSGQSDGPTAGFARDFTRHFDAMADVYPVYRRLKNLFDLAMVSALIRSQGLAEQADWHLTCFGNDPDYRDLVYQPATEIVPGQVDSVMNHRVISQRKDSSTLKHFLVGVSGGITFDAMKVLKSRSVPSNLSSESKGLESPELPSAHAKNWWWD